MKDEAFEKWAKAQGGYFSLVRDPSSGNYQGDTLAAYYGWKGAIEMMTPKKPINAEEEIAAVLSLDRERLAWIIENRHMRVQGTDERGWCVMDCSNGLTFVVNNAKTYDDAIDQAMKLRPLDREGRLPPIPAPLI